MPDKRGELPGDDLDSSRGLEATGEDLVFQQIPDIWSDDMKGKTAVVLPRSLTRLTRDQRLFLADVQAIVRELEQRRADLDTTIAAARVARVPWTAIGIVTGLTAQGAQQRWRDVPNP